MEPEIKLSAQADQDDPGVYHLTVDRDIGGHGAVQPLMQRILGLPGVNGVRREGERTIIVEKTNAEDWQLLSKTIDEMFRAHFKGNGDARQKGPKGHTRFGATLENLWTCYRQCDRYAGSTKSALSFDRKLSLWALGLSAVFGLLCSEHLGEVFGALSAVAAGVGTWLGKRAASPEREQQWARSRALAENAQSEALKFLVHAYPYDGEDAVARLGEKAARVRQEMAELNDIEDLDQEARLAELPKDWLTMDEYLRVRVHGQVNWYKKKALQHRQEAQRYVLLVTVFGAAAAVLGATGMLTVPVFPTNNDQFALWAQFLGNWGLSGFAKHVTDGDWWALYAVKALKVMSSAGWVPVLTSLGGALTTFVAQNRLDVTALTYKRTRAKLESLVAEWNDQVPDEEKAARRSEYVNRFESILNQEHAQWTTEINQGGSAPVFDPGPPAPMAANPVGQPAAPMPAASVPAPSAVHAALDGVD